MLPYDKALEIILEHASSLPTTKIALENLLGYVLAEDVISSFDMPRFSNSAVDGYGVFLSDVEKAGVHSSVKLELIGEIKAGSGEEPVLKKGSALKILTGALVPPSVEAVVMQEFCTIQNNYIDVSYAPRKGENIREKGAEFVAGKVVLNAGIRITPPIIGLLATLGYASFRVYAKPIVSLIVSGDELIKPGNELHNGQLYDANSYALKAAVNALGIDVCAVFYIGDTLQATRQAFQDAIQQADIVISTGGVSVGQHDYIKQALSENGIEPIFWQIAVKPGRPVYFSKVERKNTALKLVFGLPGNPVSALVTFHQFVKPAISKMMGCANYNKKYFFAKVSKELQKFPGRLDLVRGIISGADQATLNVEPTIGQESHMLSGLAKADCLIHFASQLDHLDAGTATPIDLLNWYE